MKIYNTLALIFLTLFASSCAEEILPKDFKLTTKDNKKFYAMGTPFELNLMNEKGHQVDSIAFYRGDNRLSSSKISITNEKLGNKSFYAKIYVGGKPFIATTTVTLLSATEPKGYKLNILNEYPHDIKAYTQGLEFKNDTLYEGTGRKGISQLRKVDYKTGEVKSSVDLDPDHFGEGITILNDKIYQLTWQANVGFVYDLNSFEKSKTFSYKRSKEGWGLCNDGEVLYKSDGTEKIWILDPETLEEKDFIQIYTHNAPINKVNELEFHNGKIYANIYQKNGIAIINPKTGAVEGVINGSQLQKKVTQHDDLDVLNGIAFNKNTNTFFVTGKNWDKLFEVEIVE